MVHMKQSILTISFVLLIVAGVYIYITQSGRGVARQQSSSTSATGQVTTTQTTGTSGQSSYTLEEVATHASANDCWMAIDGAVYDVTAFIQDGTHPGGMQIVDGCGKDASSMFAREHRGNSSSPGPAQAMLPEYRIGTLK